MAALRAYKLIQLGKNPLPNPLCPDVVSSGKLHTTIAYQHTKGPGLPRIDGLKYEMHRIDIYWLDEKDESVHRDVGYTCSTEQAALNYLTRQKERFAKGIPKRGRPKKLEKLD
jgi:hypothetical protein